MKLFPNTLETFSILIISFYESLKFLSNDEAIAAKNFFADNPNLPMKDGDCENAFNKKAVLGAFAGH